MDSADGGVDALNSQVIAESLDGNQLQEYRRVLSVAVIDATPKRRNSVTRSLSSLQSDLYLPKVTALPWVGNPDMLIKQGFDVVLVAADGDQEAALETIETLCHAGVKAAMAYSQVADDDMLIRCMRLGVREFLYYPFGRQVLKEALDRAISQSNFAPKVNLLPEPVLASKGKSLVFLGAKGGSGVTTAACNFAVSLARESHRKTLFIDLELPLGDAALSLGIASKFSTLDALKDPDRLDGTFLKSLTERHSSGLHVLAGPDKFMRVPLVEGAVDKLMDVATDVFEYVVVDAGSRWDLADTCLCRVASTIYLITQVGVSELRNANRLIMGVLEPYKWKLEIVLNRHTAAIFGMGDGAIERILTRPAQWRIPNDYDAVRTMQNTAVPLMLKDSAIQSAIQKMARSASGRPPEKTRRFGIFRFASGT